MASANFNSDRKRVVQDWSSDVCSSDLNHVLAENLARENQPFQIYHHNFVEFFFGDVKKWRRRILTQIGSASCKTGVQTCALPISTMCLPKIWHARTSPFKFTIIILSNSSSVMSKNGVGQFTP